MTLPAPARESLEERLHDAASLASELRGTAAHLRKHHERDSAYVDLANGLDDLVSDFLGAFAHIQRELDEAEQSEAHAERMADIDWHNGRVR
jgi:DNA invertase Pin-like site-specific DNA recombinase